MALAMLPQPAWETGRTIAALAKSVVPRSAGALLEASPPATQGWLRACPAPEARLLYHTHWEATVRITCQKPHWVLFVPVHIRIREAVVVAEHFLPPGVVIQNSMVKMAVKTLGPGDDEAATSLSRVVGRSLDAGVLAGAVVNPEYLSAPTVIRQGQQVVVEAQMSAVVVKFTGIALTDGKVGKRILVRNTASQKVLTGVVQADDTVQVSP